MRKSDRAICCSITRLELVRAFDLAGVAPQLRARLAELLQLVQEVLME
jgi:hypothetical protein